VLSVTGALALLAPPQQDDALVATAGLDDALVPDVLQHEDVLAVTTGALVLLAPPQQDDALVATAGLDDALVPDVLQHEDVLAVTTGALVLLAPPQQDDEDDGADVASGRFLSAFMFGSWVSRTDALSVACALREVI
jgi:hypothetical protein